MVTVAANPNIVIANAAGTNLTLSWPTDHSGWRLLVQANRTARGISTNPAHWGTLPGSASTNQVTIRSTRQNRPSFTA